MQPTTDEFLFMQSYHHHNTNTDNRLKQERRTPSPSSSSSSSTHMDGDHENEANLNPFYSSLLSAPEDFHAEVSPQVGSTQWFEGGCWC